jgi:uncharacterized Zn-binding protein involved in type VI secretion
MRPVATVGSLGVPHCTPYTIATGSPNVFVNGKPVATLGSISSPHLVPSRRCFPHVATVSFGSTSVFVNGKPMARVGDPLALCTFIATGSPTVFAGS